MLPALLSINLDYSGMFIMKVLILPTLLGISIGDRAVILTFIVNSFLIALVVMIHYEFLYRLTILMPKLTVRRQFRIVFGVLGALTAHAVEVWVFAVAYYFMHHSEGWGHLIGNFDGSLLASVYYSLTAFTTLGFGDIEPFGDIRYLSGFEALTGLVLITWTASFLFLEMQRFWGSERHSH